MAVAYLPSTNMYWASGRFGRLVAYDPRAPANVTEYIKVGETGADCDMGAGTATAQVPKRIAQNRIHSVSVGGLVTQLCCACLRCFIASTAQESNGLDRYNIDYMYAPPGTDMLLGSSRQRQLIMWQYNHMGAYRCAGSEGMGQEGQQPTGAHMGGGVPAGGGKQPGCKFRPADCAGLMLTCWAQHARGWVR